MRASPMFIFDPVLYPANNFLLIFDRVQCRGKRCGGSFATTTWGLRMLSSKHILRSTLTDETTRPLYGIGEVLPIFLTSYSPSPAISNFTLESPTVAVPQIWLPTSTSRAHNRCSPPDPMMVDEGMTSQAHLRCVFPLVALSRLG